MVEQTHELMVFPDPVSMAIQFIKKYYPDIPTVMTARDDWDWQSTLIEISDVGGDGRFKEVWGTLYQEAVIAIHVSDPDSVTASEIARHLHALLLTWSYEHPEHIHRVQSITRPVFYPNPDPYTPSYQMTISVTFEGIETTL